MDLCWWRQHWFPCCHIPDRSQCLNSLASLATHRHSFFCLVSFDDAISASYEQLLPSFAAWFIRHGCFDMSRWIFGIALAVFIGGARGQREACPESFELDFCYPFFPCAGCFARLVPSVVFFRFPFGLLVPHSFEECLIWPDVRVPRFSLPFPFCLAWLLFCDRCFH